MLTARAAGAVALTAVLASLAACSGGGDEAASEEGPVEVPEGVTLTSGGSTVEIGQAVSVVHRSGGSVPTVITVRVDGIARGTPRDVASLDGVDDKAVPFFVEASIRNEGPATLEPATVPLYALDGSGGEAESVELVRTPDGCRQLAVDERLASGGTEHGCLLFTVPADAGFGGVQVRTSELNRPVTWKP